MIFTTTTITIDIDWGRDAVFDLAIYNYEGDIEVDIEDLYIEQNGYRLTNQNLLERVEDEWGSSARRLALREIRGVM